VLHVAVGAMLTLYHLISSLEIWWKLGDPLGWQVAWLPEPTGT